MADMIRDGAAHLADTLKLVASQSVTITRGEQTATVSATVGRSVFESQDTSGIVETWESRDFILITGDLPFGEPQRGDTVVETIDGTACTYEVTAPRGTPLFHYADAFQQSVRIHTKRVD